MVRASSPEEVFETEAWFRTLREHGFEEEPQHLSLPLTSSGGDSLAVLHLMREPQGLTALSNYYSGVFSAVGPIQSLDLDRWREMGRLLRGLPGSSVIRLQPLDANGVFLRGMTIGLKDAGYWVGQYHCFVNWFLPVPQAANCFADYWSQRPPALRNSVERGRRRLNRKGDWHIEIAVNAGARLESAIGAYQAVYANSWKPAEPCHRFVPELIRTAAREGWLRLGVLWLEGVPIAAQLWLVHRGKANIFKLAYTQGYERYSPGSLLTAHLMEHVMEVDRVVEVDYLMGDDAYKRDWMSHRRERVGLVAFNPRRPTALISATRHFAGRILKTTR